MARRKPPHDDLGKDIPGRARAHAKALGLILQKTGGAELRERGPRQRQRWPQVRPRESLVDQRGVRILQEVTGGCPGVG